MTPALAMLRTMQKYRRRVVASAGVELRKRYAGGVLGGLWMVIYPMLMLAAYVFAYVVVMRIETPGLTRGQSLVFIFCGLVPYIGISESMNGCILSIKQNLHFVRNAFLPVELLPARAVLMAMVTQAVATTVLVLMTFGFAQPRWALLALPLAMTLQFLVVLGVGWILAIMALVLPDISYLVNLGLLLLMFVSPIGFRPEMVPSSLQFVIALNPTAHVIGVYRAACLGIGSLTVSLAALAIAAAISVVVGGSLFDRLRDGLLADE